MFLGLDKKNAAHLAAIDDSGQEITYGELAAFAGEFGDAIGKRTLIFIFSENSVGSLAGYTASLSSGIVPLLLGAGTDREQADRFIEIYGPEYLWLPVEKIPRFPGRELILEKFGYGLLKLHDDGCEMHSELSLLLTTSGSTGSPKLVRHSYANVEENAKNVAAFFELDESERAIALLPMQYTMGLSVVTSHLYAGATLLLVKSTMTELPFWNILKKERATSFTGVPYSFEILHKLRFLRMDLPHLKIVTQGGGKLRSDLFREFAEYAERTGKKFIATYGQTEGTARMAYLPADLALSKTGSIGRAIPGGRLFLVDDHGREINEKVAKGEMGYEGPNVTLGYADSRDDLMKGDENNGVLLTGDIAERDADGCYFIVGRKKRFLKLYGLRISLDQIEEMVKTRFPVDCLSVGDDKIMKIFITEKEKLSDVKNYIVEKTGLFHQAVDVEYVEAIPRNEAGKSKLTIK